MITWHNAKTNPPPERTEVILAIIDEDGASIGYRLRCGSYAVMDDHVLPASSVYAWTSLPAPPPPEQLGLPARR